MNQMQEKKPVEMTKIESLAMEARQYSAAAAMNMLMLGRVFIEAKAILKHGEFAAWCGENAGCSIRMAQNMMSAYTRFGNNPEFFNIGKSKLFKMLSLPEGTEEQFIKDNDIANMSSREVEKAIRDMRGDLSDCEKDEHNDAPDEKLVNELNSIRAERDRLADQQRDMIESRAKLAEQIKALKDGTEQDSQLITDQQNTIDALTEELNRYRVSEARGEVDRSDCDMDAASFRSAVHEFMGSVHQIPQMGKIFATMDYDERVIFDTLLKSVEAWTVSARKALDTIEGGFVS